MSNRIVIRKINNSLVVKGRVVQKGSFTPIGNATADKVVAPCTFYSDSEILQTGELVDRGIVDIVPSTVDVDIPAGAYGEGSRVVSITPQLNIGSVVPSLEDVIYGTGWYNEFTVNKIMPQLGSPVVTPTLVDQQLDGGWYNGLTVKGITPNAGTVDLYCSPTDDVLSNTWIENLVKHGDANIQAGNIKSGVSIGGVVGNYVGDQYSRYPISRQEASPFGPAITGPNGLQYTKNDTHLFYPTSTAGVIAKVNKLDGTFILSPYTFGGQIAAVYRFIDTTTSIEYIAIGGTTVNAVAILLASDLTLVTTLPYAGKVVAIKAGGSHLYIGGETVKRVYKYNIGSWTKSGESEQFSYDVVSIDVDSTGTFVLVGAAYYLFKLSTTDMSTLLSNKTLGTVRCDYVIIDSSNNYFYVSGNNNGTVRRFNCSDINLNKVSSHKMVNSNWYGMQISGDWLFVFVGTLYIFKLSDIDTGYSDGIYTNLGGLVDGYNMYINRTKRVYDLYQPE